MIKKLFIKTFGCQMNEYDSDKMADVLRACEGMERTDRPEEADVILFNTCSIREQGSLLRGISRLMDFWVEMSVKAEAAWCAASVF